MAERHFAANFSSRVHDTQPPRHDAEELKRRFQGVSNEVLEFLKNVNAYSAASPAEEPDTTAAAVARLKKIIAARALRTKFFGTDLFADPAWDIMLDLAIAMEERRRISISSLCIAANVPTTTALRWIKLMSEKGIIAIVDDPADRRRKYVRLSHKACEAMLNFGRSIS